MPTRRPVSPSADSGAEDVFGSHAAEDEDAPRTPG